MLSLILGYEYSIFVSYCRNDYQVNLHLEATKRLLLNFNRNILNEEKIEAVEKVLFLSYTP